jgi:hypothetical protein
MSQSVSKGTMAAIVAVVVIVLGIVTWKVFRPASGPSAAELQSAQRGQMQDYQSPGAPRPYAMPGSPGVGR